MRLVHRLTSIALLAATAAGAQQPQQPPIRPLGPVIATAKENVANVNHLRALPGGRVLVNDMARRRVLLFDSTLTSFTVVADSTSATANAYSGRIGSLIAYRGDSTLFVDPFAMSMLVLDGNGKVARVMSVPRSEDASSLSGPFATTAGFDKQGRLVYRMFPRFTMTMGPGGTPTPPVQPESMAIGRVDLASRKVDTVGFVKIPKMNMQMNRDENGRMTITRELNPLPVVDEWAVLSDGTVALVRGRDYHVDLVGNDGVLRSATKMPFDWQRLSDEDKVAFIDSVKAQRARMVANAPTGTGQVVTGGPPGGTPAGGQTQMMVIEGGVRMAGPGGDRNTPPPSGAAGGGPSMQAPQVTFVAPSELPDYKPPFFSGSVRPDADGNLWIQTIPTRQVPGGPVYDVVNNKGELIDRVQVPAGRTIAGFGAGGLVYLSSRGESGVLIEKAKLK
jgi:hypothetical protein